jgi:hypothetical protein
LKEVVKSEAKCVMYAEDGLIFLKDPEDPSQKYWREKILAEFEKSGVEVNLDKSRMSET